MDKILVKNKLISIIFFLLSFTMVIFSTEALIYEIQIKTIVRVIILTPGIFILINHLRLPKSKAYLILSFVLLSSLSIINGIDSLVNIFDFLVIIYIVLLIKISNDIDLFYKSTLWGVALGVVTVLLLTWIGILENKFYLDQLGRARFYFGFQNPNYLSLYVYSFSMFLFLLNKNKKALFFSLLIMIFTFFFTRSRTPFYAFLIFVLLYIFFKGRNLKLKRMGTLYMFVLFFMLYIFLSINFQAFPNLNVLTSWRLQFTNEFIFDLSSREFLLGGYEGRITLDNSFLSFLKNFGILFLLQLFFVIFFSNKNKQFDYRESAFLITMLIFGIFESVLVSPGIPVSILFWYLIL